MDIKGKRDTTIKIRPKFLLFYFNSKELKPEELDVKYLAQFLAYIKH